VSCRLCFKQVSKLELGISRQGKDIKDPKEQLDLVRNIRDCIQKHVEQRDVQLELLDQQHDSAKKQVQTSAPISSGQCPESLRPENSVGSRQPRGRPMRGTRTDVRLYLLNLFPSFCAMAATVNRTVDTT
jgi:hypothetical protein